MADDFSFFFINYGKTSQSSGVGRAQHSKTGVIYAVVDVRKWSQEQQKLLQVVVYQISDSRCSESGGKLNNEDFLI